MPATTSQPVPHNVTSPCIGVCRIGADGLCVGCRRSLAEIARWGTMSEAERRRWVRDERPQRQPPRS